MGILQALPNRPQVYDIVSRQETGKRHTHPSPGQANVASEAEERADSKNIGVESSGHASLAQIIVALPFQAQGGVPGDVDSQAESIRVIIAIGIRPARDPGRKFEIAVPHEDPCLAVDVEALAERVGSDMGDWPASERPSSKPRYGLN